MSPGPTFDRVYTAIKDQLMTGHWPPGSRLEPGAIGEHLAASVTPVRDALHRLVGEGLVEAPRHDGFWVPSLTEVQLRDLYAWNGRLASWSLRQQRRPWPKGPAFDSGPDPGTLFYLIAWGADDAELEKAVSAAGDRLAPFRIAEVEVLPETVEELTAIAELLREGSTARLKREVAGFHRRRVRAANLILEARRRGSDRDPLR